MLVLGITLAGCSGVQMVGHQPTQDDPPFGGGFPSSHHPGGPDDPRDQNLRRHEIQFQIRGQQPSD